MPTFTKIASEPIFDAKNTPQGDNIAGVLTDRGQ